MISKIQFGQSVNNYGIVQKNAQYASNPQKIDLTQKADSVSFKGVLEAEEMMENLEKFEQKIDKLEDFEAKQIKISDENFESVKKFGKKLNEFSTIPDYEHYWDYKNCILLYKDGFNRTQEITKIDPEILLEVKVSKQKTNPNLSLDVKCATEGMDEHIKIDTNNGNIISYDGEYMEDFKKRKLDNINLITKLAFAEFKDSGYIE